MNGGINSQMVKDARSKKKQVYTSIDHGVVDELEFADMS
jgi:hypothetical protein